MENFDYASAIAELETLCTRVEDPSAGLDDIDACLKRAGELTAACRKYLRTARETLDGLQG